MRRLLLVLAIVAVPTAAHAYPQFQLSTGAARCNQCHIAPAGGTLISGYGRDEAGDTISRGGNGAFLHGKWDPPEWLQLGGDARGAFLFYDNDATDSPSIAAFPMQAELYASVKVKDFSLNVSGNYRGTVRGGTSTELDGLGSREHYLMWRPKPQGYYARIGRFMVPYGLRIAEHPAYIRKYDWSNTEEEPYSLSGGKVTNSYEWHATLSMGGPRCAGAGCLDHGIAGYFEKRIGENMTLGAQARAGQYGDEFGYRRLTFGAIGKYYLSGPKVMLMAQSDFGLRTVTAVEPDYTNKELVDYISATWFATRGVMLTLGAEMYLENLGTPDTARHAATLEVQYFPWAHFELVLYGRASGGANILMTQLHYYL